MKVRTKTFPNLNAARGALNAAKATWTPPLVVFVSCTKQAQLLAAIGTLELATDAYELLNGRFAVIAEHPSFKDEEIDDTDIKRPPVDLSAQAQVAKAKLK